MQRVYREGHEIGNHTFTHPDISEISTTQVDLQLNLTERLFASKLGVQPAVLPSALLDRPGTRHQRPGRAGRAHPEPRLHDHRRQDRHQRLGRASAQDAAGDRRQRVRSRSHRCETKPWMRGSIILMHDGGGDRSATVAALPVLIDALRARGYEIVPVSAADRKDARPR